ncbi:type II secretion system F family protein [Candidatus Poriferisodalis sp.]|uniref:type II secretion system F family protein n=1 Tax=Candidatus Poriferisodalis sp. TaxID=3101277 RepID=UPI003B028D9F
MLSLAAVLLGMVAAFGAIALLIGVRKRQPQASRQRLRDFRSRRLDLRSANVDMTHLTGAALAAVLALGTWYATGWPVSILLGAAAGWVAPKMFATPRRRRAVADEIEAYSQWTEHLRDLVGASGSIYEAVTLSAPTAPSALRPQVARMASMAAAVGLAPALNWFAAEMKSPYADRLVLGINIAWDSGARVTEAFDSVARAMRNEVEMRRRNEVANARTWTQVVSIVGITVVSVVLMFTFNAGFFDPFETPVGQAILLLVGAMIFGNIFWVLKLSESGVPVRLLDQRELEASIPPDSAGAEAQRP